MLKTFAIIVMILTMSAMLALACVEIVGLHQVIDVQRETIRIHEDFICALIEQTRDDGRQTTDDSKNQTTMVIEATVTSYSPHREQTDRDPHVAASMRKVREGTIAVSRDLFWAGWTFGRRVYIEGHGVFEINDLMNERFERRIDVFRWDKGKAKAFGLVTARAALLE